MDQEGEADRRYMIYNSWQCQGVDRIKASNLPKAVENIVNCQLLGIIFNLWWILYLTVNINNLENPLNTHDQWKAEASIIERQLRTSIQVMSIVILPFSKVSYVSIFRPSHVNTLGNSDHNRGSRDGRAIVGHVKKWQDWSWQSPKGQRRNWNEEIIVESPSHQWCLYDQQSYRWTEMK